ncbi:hypothetical protein RAB80_018265 [Fusarium oxysporum f. sp. vasinfectum]|nr:hypothetical protein RAB80_018265 [Fusarium oxysporum f. sp. vasinfectum]
MKSFGRRHRPDEVEDKSVACRRPTSRKALVPGGKENVGRSQQYGWMATSPIWDGGDLVNRIRHHVEKQAGLVDVAFFFTPSCPRDNRWVRIPRHAAVTDRKDVHANTTVLTMAPTKTREKVARPDDRAWVGATTRKRGNTAMKRNYDFGRDCRTTSLHFFYNPIHDFWDGSGYVPPGQSLPKNLQEIVEDILRRQVVSDDKLVLQPARQRKQLCKDKPAQNRPVKEKPYRVTKPRDARRPVPLPTPRALSLRSRAGSANSRAVAAASPIHSQITVADDEVEVDGGEAGVSVNRSRRSDQSWAPSYTPASSPFVVEQNADCEPCERPVAPFAPMEGEANGEVDDGIDDTVFFPQSSNETPPVVDFTTMMVGDTWTNSNAVDFPGMAAFPDMMDFDMGNFDMDNFDLSLDLNLDGMDQLDHFETSPHRAGFSVTYPEASPSYDLTEAPGKQDNHEPVVPDVRAAGGVAVVPRCRGDDC